MYRIMIADDEGIVLDSFKLLLNEEFGDEILIETAKTGRSVIEATEQFRPDIVLMDIRMPGINGIDAIKEIRKRNSGIIFIVISAYDKFGYAQEAINLGVMEYLNKPVDRDKLIETIRRAMRQVDIERNKRSRELEILEKMETVTPILESGLIYNLLFQDFFKEDIESFKKLLEIDADYGYMMALVFGEDQEGNFLTNAAGTSVRIQNHIKDLRDIVKSYVSGVVGPVMANKIAVFIPYDKKEFEYSDRIEIIDMSRNLVKRLNSQMNAIFRIGIGTIKPLDKLMISYNEALDGLSTVTGSVVHAEDVAPGNFYEENYPFETEDALFENVRQGRMNEAIAAANQFFDWMMENYKNYQDDIKLKTLEFVLKAESLAYLKTRDIYRFRSREDYLRVINSTADYESLRKWFIDRISEACHSVMCRKEKRSNGVIDRALDYIGENYNKDISLDDVSREVNISPYYFSKIFKEATGENFIDYLTTLRIGKAKDLLDNTDKSMKEICMEVGYANPNYFSRIFKKVVGVTPTEYKA